MRRFAAVGLIGLVGGYVSILGFPTTATLVVVAALLALRARRWSGIDVGVFLMAAGAAGSVVLGRILVYAWKCDYRPCISDSTVPTFEAYVVIAAIGAAITTCFAVFRRYRTYSRIARVRFFDRAPRDAALAGPSTD